MRTDDPLADFDAYETVREKALDKLPRCSYCGEPIQDEFLYEINDELICEECLYREHRKPTEDYIACE